jgi:hypothetical protein
LAEIRTGAATDEVLRRARIVDLSLGAWRAREAARQLAAATGAALARLDGDAEMDDGGRQGATIDLAARGDPLVTTACEDAARIGAAVAGASLVAVIAPRRGLPLRAENEWFFAFLRRLGLTIALIGDDVPGVLGKSPFERRRGLAAPEIPAGAPEPSREQRRLLRLFPGLLPRALAGRLGIDAAAAGLVAAGPAHFLIPPGWRDRDPAACARDFDAMAAIEAADPGLQALAQLFCTAHFAEAPVLVALSRRAERDGSLEIARDLAERAREVARRVDDIALAERRRLEIALAEHRYADVVAAPEPSRQVAAATREGFRRLKAVAAVRTGTVAPGEPPLAGLLTRIKAGERLDGRDLHLLADAAEARLAADDPGGAFALASAVEAALAADPRHDRHAAFLVALTLARIHRLRGDQADYQAALDRAFATSLGARSLHEVLEMNVLAAAGVEDAGSATARLALLRAGLVWLALEPSEGLARSAMVAILGREAPRWQLDTEISDALGQALEAAWPDLVPTARQRLPAIRAADPRLVAAAMLAGEGAAVLWSPEGGNGAANTRARHHLIRLVLAGLATLQPQVEGLDGGTVLVDTNLGIDIPRTRAEALGAALRARARDFRFAADAITLDDELRPRFAADLQVRLAPIVAAIEEGPDGAVAVFHRHLRPRKLLPAELSLVAPCREATAGVTLAALATRLGKSLADAEADARNLERDGVIRLDP